ncbi:unnamed protein product [Didymodactylos carnosus]|uniref:Uncharacterized protein n=1 Tax=Didymodactylos carnosus TaxID=1234261 RepID=A0A814A7H1_9BILA|nr:unnamed protein product [Didymodactylos carnosus]CAF0909600.1 unnamed protein product [Didymodactylos carnosus]CAF3525472.1 unnamed protein product [Didymodactylos carnosus]CAF3690942.1 unnamed protein product [Didymodactylos carnosus]
MTLVYKRQYLILHFFVGLLLIGLEYIWRRMAYNNSTITIHSCPQTFLFEFKHPDSSSTITSMTGTTNWWWHHFYHLFEPFYSSSISTVDRTIIKENISRECYHKQIKLDLTTLFTCLRYLWLTIGLFYFIVMIDSNKRSILRAVSATSTSKQQQTMYAEGSKLTAKM